jgi:hypothetical protein
VHVVDHAVAPVQRTEEALAAIFADALGLAAVGPEEDFFALGGDSLTALTAVARARGGGVELGIEEIYVARTPRRIVSEGVAHDGAAPSAAPEQEGPVLPAQDRVLRLWRPSMSWPAAIFCVEAAGPLQPVALQAAVEAVIAHHDALRLRLRRQGSGYSARDWQQYVVPVEQHPIFQVADLSVAADEVPGAIDDLAQDLYERLDPMRGPVIQVAAVAANGAPPRYLLVVIHHFCADMHSMTILRDDLETAYRQAIAGTAVVLPRSTTPILEFATRCVEYATGPAGAAEASFWAAEARRLPTGRTGPTRAAAVWSERLRLEIGRGHVDALTRGGSPWRGLFEAVAGALVYVLSDGADDGVTSFAYLQHGRGPRFSGLDLFRTVGWPMVEVPVIVNNSALRTVRDAVTAVRQETRRPPGDGLGFQSMCSWLEGPEAEPFLAVYESVRVVVNIAAGEVDEPGRAFAFAARQPTLSQRPTAYSRAMSLACTDLGPDGVDLNWAFDPATIPRDSVRRLAQSHLDALLTLASEPAVMST